MLPWVAGELTSCSLNSPVDTRSVLHCKKMKLSHFTLISAYSLKNNEALVQQCSGYII